MTLDHQPLISNISYLPFGPVRSFRAGNMVFNRDFIVVSGVVWPVGTAIPSWASWIQDLWLQIYLCDDQSRVLAKDLRLYLPAALDYKNGVPFEFHLAPQALGVSGPLHVSFGYRMELTAGKKAAIGPDGRPQVFFANQGVLFQ